MNHPGQPKLVIKINKEEMGTDKSKIEQGHQQEPEVQSRSCCVVQSCANLQRRLPDFRRPKSVFERSSHRTPVTGDLLLLLAPIAAATANEGVVALAG